MFDWLMVQQRRTFSSRLSVDDTWHRIYYGDQPGGSNLVIPSPFTVLSTSAHSWVRLALAGTRNPGRVLAVRVWPDGDDVTVEAAVRINGLQTAIALIGVACTLPLGLLATFASVDSGSPVFGALFPFGYVALMFLVGAIALRFSMREGDLLLAALQGLLDAPAPAIPVGAGSPSAADRGPAPRPPTTARPDGSTLYSPLPLVDIRDRIGPTSSNVEPFAVEWRADDAVTVTHAVVPLLRCRAELDARFTELAYGTRVDVVTGTSPVWLPPLLVTGVALLSIVAAGFVIGHIGSYFMFGFVPVSTVFVWWLVALSRAFVRQRLTVAPVDDLVAALERVLEAEPVSPTTVPTEPG